MYSDILVAYDKSDQSRHALAEALHLAEQCDTKVTLLYVSDVSDVDSVVDKAKAVVDQEEGVSENAGVEAQREYYESQRQAIEQDVADIIAGADNVRVLATSGKAADAILELCETEHFDMLVMGARKLGFFESILGSVSSAVLKESKIPVLIVK